MVVSKFTVPPYGHRQNFVPRRPEVNLQSHSINISYLYFDQMFGDGGAFPEILMAQYPLNMGLKKNQTSNAIQLQVDADGKPKFDAIVKQNTKGSKVSLS